VSEIFIIHGWTYSLDKWSAEVRALEKLDIKPVLLKVPGLTEPSDKVWDINDYIDWLNIQLKDQDKPVVIGHSNGGRIALSYAQKYPDRLGQLILIDSAGVAHDQAKSAIKLKTLRALSKAGKPLTKVPGARKAFYKVIGARDYYEAPPNMRLTMRNMLAADQKINFSAITLPVTIIWGRDDSITPLTDGQKMHKAITGSKLYIINDARHAPFWNHSDEVAGIIKQTLQN